jgi:hypothetical protein
VFCPRDAGRSADSAAGWEKVLAGLADSAVQSRPTQMAMAVDPEPHEQYVAIERRAESVLNAGVLGRRRLNMVVRA